MSYKQNIELLTGCILEKNVCLSSQKQKRCSTAVEVCVVEPCADIISKNTVDIICYLEFGHPFSTQSCKKKSLFSIVLFIFVMPNGIKVPIGKNIVLGFLMCMC